MAFYRKLDHLSQLQAVSGMEALHDGGYAVTDENAGRIGMIVGTSEGALGPSLDFQNQLVQKGNVGGSAFKFPNTVYNAAGGYLSICAGIKGYNVTVTNGAQSGLQSVAYAMQVMRNGWEDAMLATGTDENSAIISELYHGLGLVADTHVLPYEGKKQFSLSDGSISLLTETEASANARGARVYCHIAGYGMAHESVPFGTVKGSGQGLANAISSAFVDAGVRPEEIDAVIGFANGEGSVDAAEAEGLCAFPALGTLPLLSVKDRTGEGRAASAALAMAHGALLLHGDLPACTKAYRRNGAQMECVTVDTGAMKRLLVISYGAGGSYTAVILEK